MTICEIYFMKLKALIKEQIQELPRIFKSLILFLIVISIFISLPREIAAFNHTQGEHLFIENCSGCHIKGGNIIRRNKTLKTKDLKRNGIETPEAIAKIAREGIGIMSGYSEVLGKEGDQLVANWIWEQSQKAWTQG